MESLTASYKLNINNQFSEEDLLKGVYVVVIHATRIPPHIGIIADKHYHSLTIKGHEINVPVEVLIRNTNQRKIPSLFIKIKKHPIFSAGYLSEHFISNVKQFPIVDIGIATCLSPIKLFLDEVFNVPMNTINYLYELLPLLESEGLIESASSLFIDEKNYQLPIYSFAEINEGIENAKIDKRKSLLPSPKERE
ncbi:MAG: hypothetical protein A3F72_00195 [Bacteroidetes bacterium RIFCSPLOWO2_12_FULL_35_15]|nr:MAG: hypothetical protein A3F72_00195 [Bacteroidetes bacterium RIFCSPLOWO2_12_FULL_35_15]